MRRTSITTMALSALALAAVAGCVSVDQGATPPPSGPGGSQAHPADGHRSPPIPPPVEGPAQEALEAAPPATPSRTAPPAAATAPRAQPPAAAPAARRHRDGDDSRPGRPGKRPSADRIRAPRPQADPPAVPTAPVTDLVPQVCALGGTYGGWPTGSPQARLCREAYGH
ncbi:hypothetical protein [Streptomyces lichenis]|uniref:Lipoprotein n=1 Tax=Streptomyces lichenis TaxID=2306967 RepID=A0ABT0IB13_9ACTN|nr:hypothetical protein [Streptomyces lichenis]MCK8678503.1 hypothetical protein [Streptomyces lichenis]